MCFIKTINFDICTRHCITKILNKDITVIKVLDIKSVNMFFFKKYAYYSPCQGYKYIKGKLNTSPLNICISRMLNGLDCRIIINEGFHSFCTEEDAYKSNLIKGSRAVLCKCIIPKGSTIVSNGSEIVSNQIIFIEELK